MESRSPLRDLTVMPAVVPLAWCALAVIEAHTFIGNFRNPNFDLDRNGAVTISDIWMMVRDSWMMATAFPALQPVLIFSDSFPKVYQFFELQTILERDWVLVVIGLIAWFAAFYYLIKIEILITNSYLRWSSKKETNGARAKMDAVARGERDKFP